MTDASGGRAGPSPHNGSGDSPATGRITALMRRAVTASGSLGSLVILFMTLLVVADVMLRSFFALPIRGASEIGAFLVTAVVFLQAPLAVHEQRLTQLEWFGERLGRMSPTTGTIHGVIVDTAGMVAFFLIAKASLPPLIEAWTTSEFFGTQGHFTAPSWPVRLIIVSCSLLAAAAFLFRIASRLTQSVRRD